MGMNIYQAVSYDLQTENAQMLPFYIYYSVSGKEAVIVSKLGVPRFAVGNVLRVLQQPLLQNYATKCFILFRI